MRFSGEIPVMDNKKCCRFVRTTGCRPIAIDHPIPQSDHIFEFCETSSGVRSELFTTNLRPSSSDCSTCTARRWSRSQLLDGFAGSVSEISYRSRSCPASINPAQQGLAVIPTFYKDLSGHPKRNADETTLSLNTWHLDP